MKILSYLLLIHWGLILLIGKLKPSKSNIISKPKDRPSPTITKFMRLSQEKFNTTKKKFDLMLHESLCYFSNSSWSNPVHVTLEKSGNLIHFDDYRVLKTVTIPDHYLIQFLTVETTFWRSQKFTHPRTSSIHTRKYLWMQLMFPK